MGDRHKFGTHMLSFAFAFYWRLFVFYIDIQLSRRKTGAFDSITIEFIRVLSDRNKGAGVSKNFQNSEKEANVICDNIFGLTCRLLVFRSHRGWYLHSTLLVANHLKRLAEKQFHYSETRELTPTKTAI